MTPLGTYTLHRTSLDREANALITFDWTARHEIAGGATIATATWRVMAEDAANSDLTLSVPAVATDGKHTTVRLTDAAAQVGKVYHLVCDATLNDSPATSLVESILVTVEQA